MSPVLFNILLQIFPRADRQDKQMKESHIKNKELKLSLFIDNKIYYIEELKDSMKRVQELTRQFGTVAGHKINEPKLMALSIFKQLHD